MRDRLQARLQKSLGSSALPNSLQFRLTFELILISVLGICGVTLWSAWRLERTLINTHQQNLAYVASAFPETIEITNPRDPIQPKLEQAVFRVSKPRTLVWIRSENGSILTRSQGMNIPSSDLIPIANRLAPAETPQVFQIEDQSVLLVKNKLTLDGKPLGTVYWLQDITEDQRQLESFFTQLLTISLLIIVIMMFAIANRISKVIAPIKTMSQIASNISINNLGSDSLELKQAPEEILGLARTFNDMLNRLSHSWENQRQFVGNVSHELRTPLTVISGYLQSLLRRGDNLNTYQQQALETASAEAERTIRMLQDLLDLARADSGNLDFRLLPTVLNTLVTEVVEMTSRVSNRPISIQASSAEIVAYTDQNRLEQVLINLLDNAIKYSAPDQAVEVLIEIREQQTLIHIHDQGIGIPLPHQKRIFERFYRVDEAMTRSRDGTGLGLAIAQSLIEGMKGRITLRSKPQEGSTFTISLPLWDGTQ